LTIQNRDGEAANYTRQRRPVVLVYYEVFERIDEAFEREKHIQGWRREKKEALIKGKQEQLPGLSRRGRKGSWNYSFSCKVHHPSMRSAPLVYSGRFTYSGTLG